MHHSDRGVQYMWIRYTERVAEVCGFSSVESRSDSYDIALAESVTDLYKIELIRNKGPWRGLDCRVRNVGLGRLVEQPPYSGAESLGFQPNLRGAGLQWRPTTMSALQWSCGSRTSQGGLLGCRTISIVEPTE